ncbi:MAG TPA: hypothetical protein ENJ57_05910, partial [Rhizobiales bacterium]|nr:hypothetical protein [Hyphomicrobiales bacterium]
MIFARKGGASAGRLSRRSTFYYARLTRYALLVLAGLVALDFVPWPAPDMSVQRDGARSPGADARTRLKAVRYWGYQLQNVRPKAIAEAIDLMVMDYSRDGSGARALRAKDVARLKRRAEGRPPRLVLAYLSIGEAERYRYYWWRHWAWLRPSWLGEENEDWRGNYPVRYWQKGWQRIIFRSERTALDALLEVVLPWRKPYLDRIIEAGFDGVYLDRVDAFGEWDEDHDRADRAMADFVRRLSRYATGRRAGFLIVPQNGEELLRFKTYRAAIDGFTKEDLYYGIDGDGEKNPAQEVRKSLRFLTMARRDGLPVFVVEYLDEEEKEAREDVLRRAARHGFIVQFARRALD